MPGLCLARSALWKKMEEVSYHLTLGVEALGSSGFRSLLHEANGGMSDLLQLEVLFTQVAWFLDVDLACVLCMYACTFNVHMCIYIYTHTRCMIYAYTYIHIRFYIFVYMSVTMHVCLQQCYMPE